MKMKSNMKKIGILFTAAFIAFSTSASLASACTETTDLLDKVFVEDGIDQQEGGDKKADKQQEAA